MLAVESSNFLTNTSVYHIVTGSDISGAMMMQNDTGPARSTDDSGDILGSSRMLVLDNIINKTRASDPNISELDAIRMNVNQITFAVLISVLLVADMLLAWCFSYLVIRYEKRGRLALRHYSALISNR